MGVQVSKIPKLVQDKILDYISVTDAVALSRCGDGPDIAVRHNHHFWLKKLVFFIRDIEDHVFLHKPSFGLYRAVF